MITKPNTPTMDAVELYQLLTRAAALASVSTDTVLREVFEWIKAPTFGAEDFERKALLHLINGNIGT
ncbi:hypothetical protein [Mesorhizobium sp. M0244]|uniref:hypothetical protein n=1 Tax=Mesorhizobium sp. M0244 TaxID=2956926 RepID=UPI00333D3C34